MTNKIRKWVVLSLLIFATLITACSGGASESQADQVKTSNPPADQPPAQDQALDVVAGGLGQVLDDYFTQDKPLFSGSVLVAQDGEVLLSKGYNYANWELKAPASAMTKYRISSITKPFTATMILMLAEKGLLNLDDPLCVHLADCPDSWGDISIQNLMAHTSGVPEYTTLLGADAQSREPHNVSALIDLFDDEELEFSPGSSYQYSNSNYILLGAVIEQVSGVRYDNFLAQAILNPLEMEDTGMDYASQILKNRAAGYQIQGRALVNAPYLDMSNAYATAGLFSTVGDIFTFDQALYSDQLLNPQNQELMYSPVVAADGSGGNYGFGWQLSDIDGHRRVGHSGGINGFRVFLGRYLDDQITMIILSNIETEDIDQIVEDLEQIVFNSG